MTMPHHALEITLTRPPATLHRAARGLPLAANHDAIRVMALIHAKNAHQAVRRLRRHIASRLPIDVITTHYPDADNRILLNVDLPPTAHAALTDAARRAAQPPEHFVELALHRALAAYADQETERLCRAVRQLLADANPAHLLSAVGHALTHLPESPTP
ncbi:hypothetical protein [Streptomyces sp. MB09-02B]|uniref:hypothetical protein n=1 Tax=Streptomyces sp. MB09-02B TaxID=3028667 RepID=UPI0029B4C629|nr:hypothetical protein [Streptomyces sp. MB09-02B]MDX3643795.1 hypothetical protein [Streptomyces sp. MB09-02B]